MKKNNIDKKDKGIIDLIKLAFAGIPITVKNDSGKIIYSSHNNKKFKNKI